MNSKEYWDNRFETGDWDAHGGREQTLFFAKVATDNMPEWLVKQINMEYLSICDMGCAEGDAVNQFSKMFFNCDVQGIDFSEQAVEKAKNNYPLYNFSQGDLNYINDIYDVVFSSNTLEHFRKPIEILKKMLYATKKYLILLVPFNEKERLSEHVSSFTYDSFPLDIEQYSLLYYKEIDCSNMEKSMWPGQEILVVYGNTDNIDISSLSLSNFNNMNFDKLLKSQQQLKESRIDRNTIELRISEYANSILSLETRLADVIAESDQTKGYLKEKIDEVEGLKLQILGKEAEARGLKIKISDKEAEMISLTDKVEELILKLLGKETEMSNLKNSNDIFALSKYEVDKLKTELNNIYNSDFWKVAKAYYRMIDRFSFLRKIRSFFKRIKNGNKHKIKKERSVVTHSCNNDVSDVAYCDTIKREVCNKAFKLPLYNYKPCKTDVILLSVIDWDFRFQRPQQIAKAFAEDGHRVFYFDANFFNENTKINDINENLKVVRIGRISEQRIYDIQFENHIDKTIQDIEKIIIDFNIRECTIVVEYPNWEPIVEYLKEKYYFKVVFDYIDDYTGFETNNSTLSMYCNKLFNASDLVIATSTFLYDKARRDFERVEIVRNGTEFKHFNRAILKDSIGSTRPIIGYYGALAEWFDIEKVEYIASCKPEWDIWLIGNVSFEGCNELKKYKNVKFFGEKGYEELPELLMKFDVCLIPFKSDIDLIKATNPVKFYEYLSAGKKVVATEIPELMPFKDKYVYLANDKEQFLEYVGLCVNKYDTLQPVELLTSFAEEQDWKNRYLELYKHIKALYKKVSIIVVTYNNIELTQMCIDSILQKTAYPNYEIIIVDNNSNDNTQEYLKELVKKYDNIKIILNDENTGFAKGNNIGIKKAEGEFIILLNNDTVVTRGWVTGLIKHLSDEIGMVGPITNSIGNEAMINVDYSDVSDMDIFALKYTTENFGGIYKEIPVLAMFCVAIKRNLLDEVGMLDESYEVGMFEDDDYSYAIRSKGYKVACVEDVFIHHFGRASFKKLDDKVYRNIFETNKRLFENKWGVMWVPHKYRDGVIPK